MKSLFLLLLVIIVSFAPSLHDDSEDLYKLLDVPRDANVKEIRKAFKSLAVKLHPDKNQDDDEADAKFARIARAYEILKDPDSRKRYDLHGDTGDSSSRQKYHSYTYYRDQFGIYDDDPLIVTLSKSDYEINVLDDNQAWFVNFYSPNCHHCHELAPTWRKLSVEFEGVIKIAAVNCEDDWSLCYHLGIQSYPTLMYYEKQATLHEGERFPRARTFENLKNFIISRLPSLVQTINKETWKEAQKRNWLLFLCAAANTNCPEHETRLKLSVILDGLMPVGLVTDESLIETISQSHLNEPTILWNEDPTKLTVIHGSDVKEILENVLNLLPNPETLSEARFQEIRSELRKENPEINPWLICFYLGDSLAGGLDVQLKRLTSLISNINLGLIHCGRSSALCSSLHIARYPTWGVLKTGGAFEQHHGRDILQEIVTFAKDSIKSTNMNALSPADFKNIIQTGAPWIVDWYAPWCPPCRKFMPEMRKASQNFSPDKIQFGTIDCTLHRGLCSSEGINSYPTVIFYNGTKTTKFHGALAESSVVEFIDDALNPAVITLDDSSFVRLMRKPVAEMWAVDFYAPWCGPCQKLGPEWSRLAKGLSEFPEIRVAKVDCVDNSELCTAQNVNAYPTIRLYPLGSKGLNTVAMYTGNRDFVSLKRWILTFLPTSIVALNSSNFKENIFSPQSPLPWLVEFYAPWCGHCVHFEPEYRKVARLLEDVATCAKIDCEANRVFCGEMRVTSYPSVILYLSEYDRREIHSQNAEEIVKQVKSAIESTQHKAHDEL